MPFSEKYKFIHYHIPKNAGSTVNNYITQVTGNDVQFPKLGYNDRGDGKLLSCVANLNKVIDNPDEYYKFAFVRNPYSKLVSAWAYADKKGHKVGSFDHFVKNLDTFKNNKHILWHGIISQTSHLKNEEEVINLDYLGRVETLFEDLKILSQKLNLNPTKIETLNTTKHSHWRDYYTEELKEIVYNRFEEDFKNFNYEK